MLSALISTLLTLLLPYSVLVTHGGKLEMLRTPTQPATGKLRWEAGVSQSNYQASSGALDISLRLNVQGSASPYWLLVRVCQEPGGHVDVECEVDGGCANYCEHFDAATYADLADVKAVSGDTIGELLSRLADGHPPADLERITDLLVADRAEVGSEVRSALEVLESPVWREREAAIAFLSEKQHFPEVRQALALEVLTPEQSRALEVVLSLPPCGQAVIDGAVWEIRSRR